MNPITLFLGAEGCAEIEESGVAWCRPAAEEEVAELRETFCRKMAPEVLGCPASVAWDALSLDRVGRPYFPMTLLPDAPDEVRLRASRVWRLVRLED